MISLQLYSSVVLYQAVQMVVSKYGIKMVLKSHPFNRINRVSTHVICGHLALILKKWSKVRLSHSTIIFFLFIIIQTGLYITVDNFEIFLSSTKVLVPQKKRLLICLLYTSPSPRDKRQSRMPSSA